MLARTIPLKVYLALVVPTHAAPVLEMIGYAPRMWGVLPPQISVLFSMRH